MSSTKGTAIVPGASAGIGEVYADRLARRGYDLVLVARRGARLNALAEQLHSEYGVTVRTVIADLRFQGDLEQVEDLARHDPSVTMLVNNAGTSTLAPSTQIKSDERDSMTAPNITALVGLSLAALEGFRMRKRGTLVNIGSVLGLYALPVSGMYSGTKGYVINFTRSLQEEATGSGVIIQLVLPAATATGLWETSGVPLSTLNPDRVMSAEDCVDAALAGLDLGESVTFPSVEDLSLLAAYNAARIALFEEARSGIPASRYTASLPRSASSREAPATAS